MKSSLNALSLPSLVLASAFTFLAAQGCGGGSGSKGDDNLPPRQGDEALNGGGGGGSGGGAAKPTPTPKVTPVADNRAAFEFKYPGLLEPMKAKVSRSASIDVMAWPKLMAPTLTLPRQVDSKRLDDEFCARVESSARAGAHDLVRGWDSFVGSIEVMPFATIDFANVMKRNALEAIGGVGGPVIRNQPILTSVKTRIVLSEGAISSHLGETSTLETIFTKVPVSLEFGTWNGEISAMDLLCDLRAGNAKIVFEAETDELGYAPVSEVSGLSGPT